MVGGWVGGGWVVGWSNVILDPTLALIRAQLGFRIQVGAECGKKYTIFKSLKKKMILQNLTHISEP